MKASDLYLEMSSKIFMEMLRKRDVDFNDANLNEDEGIQNMFWDTMCDKADTACRIATCLLDKQIDIWKEEKREDKKHARGPLFDND